MKFDSIFWFLKNGRELSEKEKRWEGERFAKLFSHVRDVEEEVYKVIPQLKDDFRELLRATEKNFEQIIKDKWDGKFSASPFFVENVHQGKVNSCLSPYTVRYGIDKSDGLNRLRVSITSDLRYDELICDIFNTMDVDFLDPEYNEKGVYFINKGKIELVVSFYQPNPATVILDAL